MTSEKQGYERILVATDFSAHADAALQQAVWLARKVGASITLAHVLPDLRSTVQYASYQAKLDLLYGEVDEFQREVRRESDAKLRQLIFNLDSADPNVNSETLLGSSF